MQLQATVAVTLFEEEGVKDIQEVLYQKMKNLRHRMPSQEQLVHIAWRCRQTAGTEQGIKYKHAPLPYPFCLLHRLLEEFL